MIARTPLLALSLVLMAAAAAAQPPIVGGRQHQPTRQEIANRLSPAARDWTDRAEPETDRLYDAIMRAATPHVQR